MTSKVHTLRIIFQPLARFLASRSVPFSEAVEILRHELVDQAKALLISRGDKVTVSRVALITGLTRREVGRLLEEPLQELESQSVPARVLSQWESDRRFLDQSGKARALSTRGMRSEFAALVAAVSRDISPASVLFELVRLEAVKIEGGKAMLCQGAQPHFESPEKGLNLYYRDVDTLARAAGENLFDTRSIRNVHMRTAYDNIVASAVPRIRRWLFQQNTQLHKRVRAFLSRYDRDLNPALTAERGTTVVMGSFSWTPPEDLPRRTKKVTKKAVRLRP